MSSSPHESRKSSRPLFTKVAVVVLDTGICESLTFGALHLVPGPPRACGGIHRRTKEIAHEVAGILGRVLVDSVVLKRQPDLMARCSARYKTLRPIAVGSYGRHQSEAMISAEGRTTSERMVQLVTEAGHLTLLRLG